MSTAASTGTASATFATIATVATSANGSPGGVAVLMSSPPAEGSAAPPRALNAREARKRWAALIKQVYETDPLACPKCGSEMRIIAFIERDQGDVIEKILRHCGLWEEAPARAPPAQEPSVG